MGNKPSKPIKNFLRDFGLNDKEIELYLTLLRTGPSTIMDLSRESGIKRSTTHNNVEELVNKGLVSQTSYGERRMVVAEDPEKLKFLMEQKKWNVKKLEENLPDMVKMIIENVPQSEKNNEMTVKYYIGEKEVQYVYNLIFKANQVNSFVNVDKIRLVFPENLELFGKALQENENLEMWEILEDSSESRDIDNNYKTSRYHYKFLPKGKSFHESDILIFDDNIAMIHVEQGKTSAILVSSVPLSNGLKSIHKMFWEVLK